MRLAWLTLPACLVGACLYDVAEVDSGATDAGNGGDASTNDVGGEGWLGGAGGADAEGDTWVEAAPDAGADVADAPVDGASDASDAKPDSGVTWSSCKALGYAGSCFKDNTLLYFETPSCGGGSSKCYVNNCGLKAGKCKDFGAGTCGGFGCEILLDNNQVEHCFEWTTAKCRDNTLIMADPSDPTNCLYRSCGTKSCSTDGGVPDCF
ncbi:MAG: hypothetical protein IPI67_36175 [Myxococcales bacterium]|nr:hypothetical protein [Myxococcales bacterium]